MNTNMSDRYSSIVYERYIDENGKRHNDPIARFKTVGDALDCYDILMSMSDGKQSFFVYDGLQGKKEG